MKGFWKSNIGTDIHGTNLWFMAMVFQNIFQPWDPFFKQKLAQEPDTLRK